MGIFHKDTILASYLVSSRWNEYVYRVYTSADGDLNVYTCEAMCAFDSDSISTRFVKYYFSFIYSSLWHSFCGNQVCLTTVPTTMVVIFGHSMAQNATLAQ